MATQSRTETGAVPIVSSGLSVPDNSVQHRLGDQHDQQHGRHTPERNEQDCFPAGDGRYRRTVHPEREADRPRHEQQQQDPMYMR